MVKASALLLALVAAVLAAVPGAYAACPAAPALTLVSIDHVDLYTTLTEPFRVTIKGCNIGNPNLVFKLGGLTCQPAPKVTHAPSSNDDKGVETVSCDLPAGPFVADESGLIIKNEKGTSLLVVEDAVAFHTPVFHHILPRRAPSVGITARMGISGLVQTGDPLQRYEIILIGLPSTLRDIGHHYITFTPPRLPEGELSMTSPIIIRDRILNKAVYTSEEDAFTVYKTDSYISAVSPNWAFSTLEDPVTLEISVRGVGEVTAVFASGVPCTDITQPNPMTVRCSLQPCPDAHCVGARPEGLVVEHIPATSETFDDALRAIVGSANADAAAVDAGKVDKLERLTFFWQYTPDPVLQTEDDLGILFPTLSYPHNMLNRATFRFANNSLDATVPMKMYVGGESVCSCAITHPWAIHFIVDPAKKPSVLPFTIMLTNGVTRGLTVEGVSYTAPITAPTVSRLSPPTFIAGTGVVSASTGSVGVYGSGMAPVSLTSEMSAAERRCVESVSASANSADFPTVAAFQLADVQVITRDGEKNVLPLRFFPVPTAYDPSPAVGANGTQVYIPECVRSPLRCLPGRYRVEALDPTLKVVSKPPAGSDGDMLEILAPAFGSRAMSVRIVAEASADTQDEAKKLRKKVWQIIDEVTEASPAGEVLYKDRVMIREPEPATAADRDGKKKGAVITVVFTPLVDSRPFVNDDALLDTAGAATRPSPLYISQVFERDFLAAADGLFATRVAPIISTHSSSVYMCTDFSFSFMCKDAHKPSSSGLPKYVIALAVIGGIAAVVIAVGAYAAMKKNKRVTPSLDDAVINGYSAMKN